MKMTVAKMGGLACRIVDPRPEGAAHDAGRALSVVLCHGYGAPGTDLVGLAGEVIALRPGLADKARFYFPEAPLALEHVPFGGRAWWHIDFDRLERAVRTGDRGMQDEVPEGMPAARKMLMALLDELTAKTGAPMSRVVLGGFSQGAMLTTDVTLRLEEAPAGLAIFSGTLLAKGEWARAAPRRAGLKVVQTHGQVDPILPFAGAVDLRELLQQSGLDVRFLPFMGPHTIGMEGLEALAELLEERAKR